MKCEICHNADAETAVTRRCDAGEEELYVCRACAKELSRSRQKKSQRTRKASSQSGPGMSITVSGNVGDAPPPIIGAILDAVQGMVSDLEKAEKDAKAAEPVKMVPVDVSNAAGAYRIGSALHLEGLHLIGELDGAIRAARALKLELAGTDSDGVKSTGHVFRVTHHRMRERAERFAADLVEQERNARIRLFEELPRVFGDSLCRALAILKNCRLLSPGELFDLLSPLRLAAIEGLLEGISLKEIEKMLSQTDLSGAEDSLSQDERDRVDAERADEMNRRFEDVVLGDSAEERFMQS